MDKPEPLSDEEILDLLEDAGLLTTAKFRIINGLVRSRPASVVREIVDRTQRIVAARYEAQENHRARTVAKLVGDLAGIAASRDQWKAFADSLIGAGERREARIAELERERDALRADADRYKWALPILVSGDEGCARTELLVAQILLGLDGDAAVDAARAAQEKPDA
ncbi:MAG: hypothetical protein AB7L90_25795 [Hyphomicrobiaceae bacterium]